MAKHVMLNNISHKDLRVITRFGAEYGDSIGTVMTVPTEFADMQREFPIFFRKDSATGEYHCVALLGFEKDENLFLEDGKWNANYLPGMLARGPFLIGVQQQQVEGELRNDHVIHIDLDHPRVSQTEGERVFLPQGGNSPYLDHISNVLSGLRDGIEVSKQMFAIFQELDLIEPVGVDVKVSEEQAYSLVGLHTIHRGKLAALSGEALERLHKSGFLEGAYLIMASLSNMKKLISFKQRRLLRRAS